MRKNLIARQADHLNMMDPSKLISYIKELESMVQNEGSQISRKEFEQQPLRIKPSDIKKPGEAAGSKTLKANQVQREVVPQGNDSSIANMMADTAT